MSSFENFGLNEKLLSGVKDLGFVEPTPIQEKVIPLLLESEKDIMGLAQTGTGKTAAFGLPIINKIDVNVKPTQAIILSPTRELCVQIAKDMVAFAKYMPEVKIVPVYGGASIETQIKGLKAGAHIVVGTPGRVLDLIERKALKIDKIKYLVLDEADEMLNMGFKEDIDAILETTPDFKQTLLFSATMPDDIRRIADDYMMQPMEISVGKKNSGAENVEHVYYLVSAKNRYLALKRVVDINPNIYGIVFCRTRKETQEVADQLIQDGYNADSLHGDLSQAQRDMVMAKFRAKHLQILVATDVAARGIDVNDLTHIINYNLPDERETYIHRSGRTGRAGKKGVCVTIVHTKEEHKIREIEKLLKKDIVRKKIPDGKEICMIQLMAMIDRVLSIETIDNQIKDFLPAIMLRLQSLEREELIKRFVSTEFNRFLNYYKGSADINIYDKENGKKGKGRKSEPEAKGKHGRKSDDDDFSRKGRKIRYTKFFVTIGEKDGLTKMKLMDVINSSDLLAGAEVGKIEILAGHTFFEVDSDYQEKVVKVFKNRRFMGKRLKIEVKPKKGEM